MQELERVEAQELNTTEEKTDVYIDSIHESIANYCIDHDIEIDGCCDYTSREIRIRDDNVNEVGDFDELMRKQLRHEIIHAFLAESGLQANYEHYRQFGHDETLVDWFAIQFPKMIKAFESVNAI